jgi:hypothetical protein
MSHREQAAPDPHVVSRDGALVAPEATVFADNRTFAKERRERSMKKTFAAALDWCAAVAEPSETELVTAEVLALAT